MHTKRMFSSAYKDYVRYQVGRNLRCPLCSSLPNGRYDCLDGRESCVIGPSVAHAHLTCPSCKWTYVIGLNNGVIYNVPFGRLH